MEKLPISIDRDWDGGGGKNLKINNDEMTTDQTQKPLLSIYPHYLSIQTSAEDNRPWYRKLISPIVSFGVEIVAFILPSCFY